MTRFTPSLLGAAVAVALLSGSARAEYYGLMNGRSVDPARLPGNSVEAGAVFGDLYDASYQYFGARFNYRTSPALMLYGDIGQTEVEDADGIGFGIGGYYVLDGVFSSVDFAIKGSYHRVELEDGGSDATFTGLVIEGIVSGRQGLGASGNIGWYANLGVNRLGFDDAGDDETELGFGGGIVVPNASGAGEFYAGLDIIDEMTFGAGYRYFLQ